MRKGNKRRVRTSSATLAAGVGAAMCFSAVEGAVVSKAITESNTGSSFAANDVIYAFDLAVMWTLSSSGGRLKFVNTAGPGVVGDAGIDRGGTVGYAQPHNAGVLVGAGLGHQFSQSVKFPGSISNKYFAVRFTVAGPVNRYAWLRVVESNAGGTTIKIDRWGYEDSGASINTLAESVKTSRIVLSDGSTKLLWTNREEEGVASYAVQEMRDGAWTTVDTFAPGDGRYALKVTGEGQNRLLLERADGSSDVFSF